MASTRRERVRTTTVPGLNLNPYIAGEFAQASSTTVVEDHDPYTGELLAQLPVAGTADIARALESARALHRSGAWARAHNERRELLMKLADLVTQNHDTIAELEACDIGKPLAGVGAWDIKNAAAVYGMYGEAVGASAPAVLAGPSGYRLTTTKEPVGVVAALVPWNFPFPCISWKLAPALAAGCPVILKSPERAPLSAQYLAALIHQAGFPPGALSILTGPGQDVGSPIVSSDAVNMISFTGATDVAAAIMRESAPNVPSLLFELGGKGANIVCEDADLAAAVDGTVTAMFDVAGESCCAGSRTIVLDEIYDEFCDLLGNAVRMRRLGDPLDRETQQGPLIDQRQVGHVDSYVSSALASGSSLLVGGRSGRPGPNFYEPTVLRDVDPDSPVAQQEVFGPVGCVIRASDFAHALELGNGTEYGLSASIWTTDRSKQERFVKEMEVGVCWVNSFGFFEITGSWGGRKRSGHGRELGLPALEEFLVTKTIYMPD
jgi:aldehyde dehydrogenase (NAD+)